MNALVPGSPEWARKVTASKVAAILGLSPWDSPYSIWRKMRGDVPSDNGSNAEAKARGHYLESAVIAWWLDQHPDAAGLYRQHPLTLEEWGAATPDLTGEDDGLGNVFTLDAKTAADDEDWWAWDDDAARLVPVVPPYYVAQAYWQLACHPRAQVAYVAVLFGSPRFGFAEFAIERDDELVSDLVEQCREFHASLSGDVPPTLDGSKATYETARRAHALGEGDVELTAEQAREFIESAAGLKAAETRARLARSVVLEATGDAKFAKHAGVTVARRQRHGSGGVALVQVAKTLEPQPERRDVP